MTEHKIQIELSIEDLLYFSEEIVLELEFSFCGGEKEAKPSSILLFSMDFFRGNLDFIWSSSQDMKTSPPMDIKMIITMSWKLEKTSISTVDMLEFVSAETEVKNKSKLLGLKEGAVLGFENLKAKYPTKEIDTK